MFNWNLMWENRKIGTWCGIIFKLEFDVIELLWEKCYLEFDVGELLLRI